MKLFHKAKDGGVESTVTGYWLAEIKSLFSALILRFDGLSREAFHTHAFDSISWVLSGGLREEFRDGRVKIHLPSWRPIFTRKTDFHKVDSIAQRTWVVSFRGPWAKTWKEYLPTTDEEYGLTNGRKRIG